MGQTELPSTPASSATQLHPGEEARRRPTAPVERPRRDPRAQLTRAGWRDVEALGVVIAEAVHQLDLYRWLIPAPVARWDILPTYFQTLLHQAMTAGEVYTNHARTAVAVWLRRGDGHDEDLRDCHRQFTAVTGAWADRFRSFDAARTRHHPAGVRHDHLAVLAVQSSWQRQGIGAALLSAYHQMVHRDDVRLPTYLQATHSAAHRLFLRHCYRGQGPPIQLPEGSCLTPMWRQAAIPPQPPEHPA